MRHPWRSLILAGLFGLLFALALFAHSALAAPPQEDEAPQPSGGYPCTGEGVYLYEDINYGGACIRFITDDPNLGDDGWHDRASSIKFVGLGYAGGRACATLYEHENYGGAFSRFCDDDPWLGDNVIDNDRADSIAIVQFPFCDMVSQIPKAECEALVAFYNSTFGPYWTNRTGWLANYTPCSWYGVTCAGGHVTQLWLWGDNLAGSIPSTLSNLSSLNFLGLPGNRLTGSIPSTLGNLSNLQELDLAENLLTGSIPSTLGNLSNLQQLNLAHNQLTGGIPSTLGNLSNLRVMALAYNQLTGSIPTILGDLSNLQVLNLPGNQLTGSIPSILGNLSNLESLYLGNNQLSGSIPSTLGNLSHLMGLGLSVNSLRGSIPSSLGNLSNLFELQLHNNQLTGSIPNSLGNLSNLGWLSLSTNPSLSGPLPQSLKNLAPSFFYFQNTNLCEPPDAAFQAWLASIPNLGRTNVKCADATATVTRTPTLTPTRTRTPQRRARLPIVMKNYRAFGDDNFSATTLNARWWWVNADPAKWSLTARPGFLRILTSSGGIGSKNLALQNAPTGDYTVQTRLLFTPTSNYQIAGIAVYKDSANYLMLGRCYCNLAPPLCRGNAIYFDHIEGNAGVGSNFAISTTKTGEAYLRLVKRGSTYTAYYSENGSAWTLVGAHTVGVALPYAGLTTGQDQSNAQIPADFDYFDIAPPSDGGTSDTATPTRTPTPGALIFADDLNDGNLAGWTAQGGTWTNPGTYMRGASNGTYAWNMRAETGANVVYEGTVNLLSGKGAGIIARASADGTESYFVFLNAERGGFEFCLNHEGWIMGHYPMTVQYNHQYHLKLVLDGNYLEGYLDGVRRIYGTYSLHSAGQFGTFVWAGEAAFDNVKAWSLP